MTLQVGDRVQVKHLSGCTWSKGVGTAVVVQPQFDNVEVLLDDHKFERCATTPGAGSWSLNAVEKIEEPKFKVGDRVALEWNKGFEYTIVGRSADTDHCDGSYDWRLESLATGRRLNAWEFELTKVGVPFKLEVGDRVINRATGRKGVVFRAPISKALKVGDINPPIGEAALAIEVEEYEDRHPGTYDLIKKAPW